MLKLLSKAWHKPASGAGAAFELRGLNYREMMEIREIMAGQSLGPGSPEIVERMLEMAVTNWREVDKAFAPGLTTMLPSLVQDELAAEIWDRSGLSGEQEKNSSSPSTSRRREKTSTAPTADTAASAKKTKRKGKTRASVGK